MWCNSMRVRICIAIAFICVWCIASGQGNAPIDMGFHFVVAFAPVTPYPEEKPLDPSMEIAITSFRKATVRIRSFESDDPSIDTTVVVSPAVVSHARDAQSGTLRLSIPITFLPNASQSRLPLAIEVTSDELVSVATRQSWRGNGEESTCLPTDVWGKKYTVMSWSVDRCYSLTVLKYHPGFILIIAKEDGTVVSITPTDTTQSGVHLESISPGQTKTVTLNAHEVFLVTNAIDSNRFRMPSADLSCSAISSTKPVSVMSGHTKGSIVGMPDLLPSSGTTANFVRNNLHETLYPNDFADTLFVVAPAIYTAKRTPHPAVPQYQLPTDSGDVVRVTALNDGTVVYETDTITGQKRTLATLGAGQSYVDSVVYRATVYSSSKPVLLAQYQKSYYDVSTNHTPGMPSMSMVPSVNRWITRTGFQASDGMDNFLVIVLRESEFGEILFDEKSLAKNGFTYKKIGQTEYAYVRVAITSGNHTLTTSRDDVRFAAWYVASLDGVTLGRAYSRCLSVNCYAPGKDSIVVSADGVPNSNDTLCGRVSQNVKVIGTTGLQRIYADDLYNYTLDVDDFAVGAMDAHYELNVIDKYIPANALVKIQTRSGEYLTQDFTYEIANVTDDGTSSVPPLSPRSIVCFDVSLSNNDQRDYECAGFTVDNADIEVSTTTAMPVVIPAGESKKINVCVSATKVGVIYTTLYANLNCYLLNIGSFSFTVRNAYMETPDVSFGKVEPDAGASTRVATIVNPDNTPLIIDSLDLTFVENDPNFTVVTSTLPTFPMQIPPQQSVSFDVSYAPNGDTGVHATKVEVYSNAISTDKTISISATSSWASSVDEETESTPLLIYPNPAASTSRTTIIAKPFSLIRIINVQGSTVATIHSDANAKVVVQPSLLGLSRGVYFVREENVAEQYVIKQRSAVLIISE